MDNRNILIKLNKGAILVIILVLLIFASAKSQELEPRALTNLPLKSNFILVGYGYGSGNIMMDAALPIENFHGRINTLIVAYAQAINFFGKSGKVDIMLPFGGGAWEGTFEDEYFEDYSTGFGDLRIRATINLTGAPSLSMSDFSGYKQKTVSGLSVQLILPTGNYNHEQLPNLGSNRWTIRAAYGVSCTYDRWVFEAYGGVWLFSNNHEFLVEYTLSQSPLWVIKGHLTRTFKNKMWLALDLGYGYGGQTYVDDVKRDAIISGMRIGLTYSLPINPNHALKFTAVSGVRFQQGGNLDAFGVAYQYRWNRQSK